MQTKAKQSINSSMLSCNLFFLSFLLSFNLFALQRDLYRLRVPYAASVRIGELFEVFNAIDDGDLHEAIRLLEENPYLVTTKDSRGYTPLHHAIATENERGVIAILMVEGHERSFTIKDKHGLTPLFLAAICANRSCFISLLLEKGIEKSFNIRDRHSGGTVLHLVISSENTDLFYLLMEHRCVNLMFGKKNKRGKTPLELAYLIARRGHKSTTSLVLPRLEEAYLETGALHAFKALRIVGSHVIPPSHLRRGAGMSGHSYGVATAEAAASTSASAQKLHRRPATAATSRRSVTIGARRHLY